MTRSVTIVNTSNHRHENVLVAVEGIERAFVLEPNQKLVLDPDKVREVAYQEADTPVPFETDSGFRMIPEPIIPAWRVCK